MLCKSGILSPMSDYMGSFSINNLTTFDQLKRIKKWRKRGYFVLLVGLRDQQEVYYLNLGHRSLLIKVK